MEELKRGKIVINEREKKLIEMIREIGYGEIRIIVQDKQPIRIEELKKSIKL
ncbi:ATP-dependent DNA helicase RuvA [Caloranaerobacter azorensis H53214]|uniref:ATP-dependent DNA helicase RuvA n=1 Tax=Caloranaerobacter azorensis H53214 TaxID=1156417 RepID=A0A096BJN8_9FIRM|nr:ATP-dependent DNA helicase RuvA [Caloranaerobacter azorensis H53214]